MLCYIHIPFCDSKCHYCAFYSKIDENSLKEQYLNAIKKQLIHDLSLYEISKDEISSVFIGGGTPSSVHESFYEEIFLILENYLNKNAQITTEANPNSANQSWLKEMKNFGVNRISFGVQSFNDEKLKFLGRAHDSKTAKEAIYKAQECGYENINIDLIYDTKFDDEKNIFHELSNALILPINHISAYELTLEANTVFYKNKTAKKYDENLGRLIKEVLEQYNFLHYEVSNYAKDEKCTHNLGYWSKKEYLGIGASAVGFIKNHRTYPKGDIQNYIKNPLFKHHEALSLQDLKLESIFLGLRSEVGINLEIFTDDELKRVKILLDENKIFIKNNILYNKDFFISDEIALFLVK